MNTFSKDQHKPNKSLLLNLEMFQKDMWWNSLHYISSSMKNKKYNMRQ